MEGQRFAIVFNPVSGTRRGRSRVAALASAFEARGQSTDIYETQAAGDAIRIASECVETGHSLIIAAGGDGTLSEVVQGILSSKNPAVPLSFLNIGSGGDFARPFLLDEDTDALAERIMNAAVRPVDAGVIETTDGRGSQVVRYFVNIASAGFTGKVVQRLNASRMRGLVPSALIYPFYIIAGMATYSPYQFRLILDDQEELELTCAAIVIANGRFFGRGLEIAPLAALDDGLLDVIVVPARGRVNLIASLMLVRRGVHLDEPDVLFRRARKVHISEMTAAGSSYCLEADGETQGPLPATISVQPGGLNIRI